MNRYQQLWEHPDWRVYGLLPILYFAAMQLSFFCGKTLENEVIIWMPNAVLLAALLRFRGERALAMGALTFVMNVAGNLPTASWPEALLLSMVNLLEVGLTYLLMRASGGASPRLDRMHYFISFVVSGPLLSAFAAGLLGAWVIGAYHAAVPYSTLMRVWWFDDGLGMLIFTPLLLLATQGPDEFVEWRSFDFAMLILTVGLVSLMYFSNDGMIGKVALTPTILIPPILVIAMRFGIFWTSLGVALVSLATCRMVAMGGRPFGPTSLEQTIIHTQEFILTFSLICMGAAILRSQLRKNERGLEEKVRERTSELSESLTQLKQTQSVLVQSEKLASLGSLVAGVAHELNTPIGNAVVSATVLQHRMEEMRVRLDAGKLVRSEFVNFFDEGTQIADMLSRSCLRASELIESFKQVAVDRASERRRSFHLEKLLRQVEGIWRLGHKDAGFAIEIDVDPALECTSYPGPLEQIATNLINNAAVHAFDGAGAGGVLRIGASATADDVTVYFTDNGKGMDGATLARVFDPFFTTRLGQGGSGLGLSISRNAAVGILGGNLRAASTPGHGSTFTLVFPRQAPV